MKLDLTFRRCSTLFVSWLLLTNASPGAEGRNQPGIRRPQHVIPRLLSNPRVDGQLEKQEWLTAAQLSPLLNADTGTPGDYLERLWIGLGSDALYVAFQLDRPPAAIAPSANDFMEIFLSPESSGKDFVFRISGTGEKKAGVRTDSTHFSNEVNWDAQVRVAETGWEGEIRIPFRSLGIDNAEQLTKEPWRFLFQSKRVTPDGYIGRSSFLVQWPSRIYYSVLNFGDANAPTIRFLDAGQLPEGQAGVLAELVGGATAKDLEVRGTLLQQVGESKKRIEDYSSNELVVVAAKKLSFFEQVDNGGEEDLKKNFKTIGIWNENIALKAKESARVVFDKDVPPGNYAWIVAVVEKSTKRLLAGFALPFEQRTPLSVSLTPFLLTAKTIRADIDYRRLKNLPASGKIQAELKGKDGRVLSKVSAPFEPKLGRTSISFPAENIFGQAVNAVINLVDEKGKSFGNASAATLLPSKPIWLDNRIGITDEPLPPWPALKVQGQKITVPLRQIELGSNGLPKTVNSRNRNLLAAPMDLLVGGKTLRWSMSGPKDITKTKAEWNAQAEADGTRLNLKTTIEYDGMIRVDLTVTPKNGTVSLKDWVLSMPYRAGEAPEIKDFEEKAFVPYYTVGDIETGIQWFCEAPKGWNYGDEGFMSLKKNGDRLDWIVRFFGKQGTELNQPLTITFGLIPLPTRELNVDYQYNNRRVTFFPDDWPADQATMMLTYDTKSLLNSAQGTIYCRASWWANDGVIFRIGRKNPVVAVCTYLLRPDYITVLSLLRQIPEITDKVLKNPKAVAVEQRHLIRDYTTWQPLALSWKQVGDQAELSLLTVEPFSKVRRSTVNLPWAEWQAAVNTGELIFGGSFDIAFDDIFVSKKALSDSELLDLANLDKLPSGTEYTLVDSLDQLRFSRGLRKTLPTVDASGKGGIAGGKYSGIFASSIDGLHGQALFLRYGARNGFEVMKAYGVKYLQPFYEQFTHLLGYYTMEFVPSPILRDKYLEIEAKGFKSQLYGGFGLNGEADINVRGYAEELSLQPKVPSGDGWTPMPVQATADYYLWSWKNNIDYFHAYSGHFDNTVNCRMPTSSLESGYGWFDRDGKLQGSYPIFAAREFSKRLRWLFHVYRKEKFGDEGVYSLHAGGRFFFAVADFADIIQTGEGWMAGMGGKFHNDVPEVNWNMETGYQELLGVPIEILTKRSGHPFGPNMLEMTALINQQSLRFWSIYFNPSWYYIIPGNPVAAVNGVIGKYDPYYNDSSVTEIACPLALWWQLLDDFKAETSTFHPYWKNQDLLQVNHEKLRSSFYLHQGKDILLIVSNFAPDPVQAKLTLNFGKMGLGGKKLAVWDAYTDEGYQLSGNNLQIPLPQYSYRIVRIASPQDQ